MTQGLAGVITSEDNKPLPIPQKPVITADSQRDFIQYKNRVFEVPRDIIIYHTSHPSNLPAIIARTNKNGIAVMYPNGSTGCHYCSHYQYNIDALLSGGDEVVIHDTDGEPSIAVKGCQYKSVEDVKWATRFTHKSGRVIMAQKTPCVVDDSMIAYLAESGKLDEYEVKGSEFNYPTLQELTGNKELQKKFEVKQAKKGYLAFLREYFS